MPIARRPSEEIYSLIQILVASRRHQSTHARVCCCIMKIFPPHERESVELFQSLSFLLLSPARHDGGIKNTCMSRANIPPCAQRQQQHFRMSKRRTTTATLSWVLSEIDGLGTQWLFDCDDYKSFISQLLRKQEQSFTYLRDSLQIN
jgi:hypothetical protein